MQLAAPVMSMASASNGRGYWLVASDGGIFAFGVPFEGSLPEPPHLIGGSYPPTVRMRAISSNDGYYLLGLDGSVAAFGTARFFGSAAPSRRDRPDARRRDSSRPRGRASSARVTPCHRRRVRGRAVVTDVVTRVRGH